MVGNFWGKRSLVFNNLDWVKDSGFLKFFIDSCDIRENSVVLDIGCGTGFLSRELSLLAKMVVAVDISPEMLEMAAKKAASTNLIHVHGDAQCLQFVDNSFDLVAMRMTLHHIEDTDKALSEAHRVLKKGGRFVLCEGIPPDARSRRTYEQVFSIKEKRHTFSVEELANALYRADFEDISLRTYLMEKVSVTKWLRNSAVDEDATRKIMNIYRSADNHFRKASGLIISGRGILIDWKFALVSGRK